MTDETDKHAEPIAPHEVRYQVEKLIDNKLLDLFVEVLNRQLIAAGIALGEVRCLNVYPDRVWKQVRELYRPEADTPNIDMRRAWCATLRWYSRVGWFIEEKRDDVYSFSTVFGGDKNHGR